jgi:hypothetical protein
VTNWGSTCWTFFAFPQITKFRRLPTCFVKVNCSNEEIW